ncbi:MAG: hypothetical protein ACM3KR_03635 [Deltaproteobacteria bacterium]
MEDKAYELIQKMYVEFTDRLNGIDKKFDGIDSKFDGIDKKFQVIDNRFDNIEKEIKQNGSQILRLENQFHDKIGILFDAHKSTNERLDRLEAKFDDIAKLSDMHDVQIKGINDKLRA